MELLIFIAGFVLGGIAVWVPFYLSRRNTAAVNNAL